MVVVVVFVGGFEDAGQGVVGEPGEFADGVPVFFGNGFSIFEEAAVGFVPVLVDSGPGLLAVGFVNPGVDAVDIVFVVRVETGGEGGVAGGVVMEGGFGAGEGAFLPSVKVGDDVFHGKVVGRVGFRGGVVLDEVAEGFVDGEQGGDDLFFREGGE